MVHDQYTGMTPTLGFRVKSQLGSPSTLINGSKLTNFEFKLDRCLSPDVVEKINSLNPRTGKLQKRLAAIKELTDLSFSKIQGTQYSNNLKMISSDLEVILANAVFSYFSGEGGKINEVCNNLEKSNPCHFDLSLGQPFYHYKFKKLLVEHVLGMVPKSVWKGEYDATGGYIIVKDDGELISYDLICKNLFENYLLHNTRLDSFSTKPNKGDYGYIYQKDGAQFFALNLMVKFLK